MPEFRCRIGAPDGRIIEERRLASTEDALRRELEGEGFHIFELGRTRSGLNIPFIGRKEKVSGKDFLLFNTQLQTLLRAGLPLAQSMDLLKDQQTDPHFRALLTKVHQQLTTGIALSDAFLSLGDVFPRLYGNSIKAGEQSGELEAVLGRYVEYQRLVETVRRKIIAALTYPLVLVSMAITLIIILMTFVIPSFAEFYVNFEAELPLPTVLVMGLADFMKSHLIAISVSVLGLYYGFRAYAATPKGRMRIDRIKLALPLMGTLSLLFAMSQFTRSMSVLLSGGTPMVPAIDTAATSISNVHISEIVLSCVKEVREGRALSDALDDTGRVPDLALAMMRVGEATGALPEMLNHTSEFFDEEIEFSLSRIVTLFEPAILVMMGIIVAGLLLAVYYPLLTLVTQI